MPSFLPFNPTLQTGLATPSSSDALLARCVKALAQLQWGFEGHSSCLSELYGGLAQLFAADRPTELGEDGAVASDRYGFETDTLQTHFVPLLAADLAADGAAGDEDTAGRPTTAAIVVGSSDHPPPPSSASALLSRSLSERARTLSHTAHCLSPRFR